MTHTLRLALLGSIAAIAAPAAAQTTTGTDGDHHADQPETIVVTALSRNREDFLGGVSVLSGADLDAARRTSIGETLAQLPGVSATSFGPTASRPVLRGFQGDRIRVLTDGIGSFDASSSSVDHAVAINPLLAERIEVLRGPAALLYGSAAIGGVVNVLGTRIPRSVPAETVHVEANADYGSAAEERRAAGIVDVAIGGNFVVHLDGSYAKTDDLRTGGYLLSRPLRAAAAASPDAEVQELATLRGRLPNTASEQSEFGGGVAYVAEGGNIGVSFSRLDNNYGVPIRFPLEPGEEAEAPTLDVRQDRVDLRAEITPATGAFDAIRLRAGYGDYRHFEIEDTGEIATTFLNDGAEARLEFVQRRQGAWSGAFGAQLMTRDFTVIGEEAFLPPTSTAQVGLFAVQNLDLGAVRLEVGGRYENTTTESQASEALGTERDRRTFDAFSGSIGGSVGLADTVRLGLNLSHTERAPTVEELYAAGPHLATQAFEVGNADFAKERSNGAELVLRGGGDAFRFEVSGYYNDFSNFIFQAPTGEEEDGLPVYAYQSAGAEQWGLEGEVSARLARIGEGEVRVEALADYVRVTLDDVGPAPFIPPLRALGAIEYRTNSFDLRGEVEHVTEQERIAQFETETPAYTLVNARAEWRPGGPEGAFAIRVAANNIFDVEARRHASFLKDYAPLAGRDIRVGGSIRF
ncbi:iron complex outermembrane receptor protein [Sphingomonas jejuensis]|uniref:Iron complex outermembrane receptor protein n=1 Tax=Sphingomonas jejuensis TaxID=904715 RepID=A0ABX0XKP6_9SPHN|nr:TonB-dependent receptor [Sphingomonas jejuensis]NJC33305.1 iron complex outermembrane receptor protein [Sphingomonas jejuensis]